MGTFNVGPVDEEFTWEGKKQHVCARNQISTFSRHMIELQYIIFI